MPLINCKIHLELNWTKNCVMSTVGDNDNKTTFQITSTKLHVPIAILSTKDNVNLTKQLNEGFKTSVYWNEYKSKIETKEIDPNNSQMLQDFLLMLPFKELIDYLFLLLTMLIMVITRLKETVIENIFSQE